MNMEVYCDFDGTVTIGDITDLLLESLADPAWMQVEEKWERGEIGSRECMAQQVSLIRGGWAAVEKVLQKCKIDPYFKEFALWCKTNDIRLNIASDGIDKVITYMFEQANVTVDSIKASQLAEHADGSLELCFPYASLDDNCQSCMCKCELIAKRNTSQRFKVLIGDGKSDFCWSDKADLVLAKSKLVNHCREKNVIYKEFDNFADVKRIVQEVYHPLSQTQVSVKRPSAACCV